MLRTYNWNIPEPAVLAEDRASRLKYAPELSHVSKLGLVAMLHVGLNFSVAQRRKPTFFGWSRRRTFFTRCQLRFLYFWRGVGYASYFWRDACHAFYFWRDACYAFYFWRGAAATIPIYLWLNNTFWVVKLLQFMKWLHVMKLTHFLTVKCIALLEA